MEKIVKKESKTKKRIFALVVGLMVMGTVSIPAFAASYTLSGTITGDGVRLRTAPDWGTILELMYKGEKILADPETQWDNSPHVKRVQTGTIGYVDCHYISW